MAPRKSNKHTSAEDITPLHPLQSEYSAIKAIRERAIECLAKNEDTDPACAYLCRTKVEALDAALNVIRRQAEKGGITL